MRFELAEATRVVASMELGSDHHTPWGVVHGGVYTTAIESAASVGASLAVLKQEGRAARHALTGEVQGLGERHLQALLDRPVRVLARDIAQAARQEEVDALVGEARARPGRAQLLPAAGLQPALLAQLAAS